MPSGICARKGALYGILRDVGFTPTDGSGLGKRALTLHVRDLWRCFTWPCRLGHRREGPE